MNYFLAMHDCMLALFLGESTKHLLCQGSLLFLQDFGDVGEGGILSDAADVLICLMVKFDELAEVVEMTEVSSLGLFSVLLPLLFVLGFFLEPAQQIAAIDDLAPRKRTLLTSSVLAAEREAVRNLKTSLWKMLFKGYFLNRAIKVG